MCACSSKNFFGPPFIQSQEPAPQPASAASSEEPSQNEADASATEPVTNQLNRQEQDQQAIDDLRERFRHQRPRKWSDKMAGIVNRFQTNQKEIALTFDACGVGKGWKFDRRIYHYLVKRKIPATFFLAGPWIKKNPYWTKRISEVPFFDIQNHGFNHRPCSINGRKVYGMRGTRNIHEAYFEVENNSRLIEQVSGKKPTFFRPGTVYFDDVCLEMLKEMNYVPTGYAMSPDGGGTMSASYVFWKLKMAQSGDIIILHANLPKSGAFAGLWHAVPHLQKQGFKFVLLSEKKHFESKKVCRGPHCQNRKDRDYLRNTRTISN